MCGQCLGLFVGLFVAGWCVRCVASFDMRRHFLQHWHLQNVTTVGCCKTMRNDCRRTQGRRYTLDFRCFFSIVLVSKHEGVVVNVAFVHEMVQTIIELPTVGL